MKIKIFAFLMSGIALFSSCDKNIGKIEEIAENFVTSVNNNDKVSIYEINPLCRTYKHMNLPSSLSADDLHVEFNEEDSTYLAKYSDNQYLVFKVDGEDAKIIDSYGILCLDSVCYELAAQLGVPVKQKSDLYNAKLFNEDDSRFLDWLKDVYKDAANGYLDVSDGRYTCTFRDYDYPSLKISEKITNKGSKSVSGDDYVVEYTIEKARGKSVKLSHVNAGVDLMPGESSEISFYNDEAYYWAVARNLSWTSKIVLKKTIFEVLLKYGKFKGDEYDRFINRGQLISYYGAVVAYGSNLAKTNKNKKKYSSDEEVHLRISDYVANIPDFENLTYGDVVDSLSTSNEIRNYLGFKRYDVILEINGRKLLSNDDYYEIRNNLRKGDKITYKILRQGKTLELEHVATNMGDTTTTKINWKNVTEL